MRIVSLFAGAGGEVLGAHRAGLEHVEAVEWNADAANTLELATGGGMFGRAHPAWSGAPLLVRRCSVADWTPVPADIWWASPPCQPDSNMGQRLREDDERDGWPMIWDRLDHGPMPRWCVCENVGGVLQRVESLAAEMNSRFPAATILKLSSHHYGVPQERFRVFIIGGPRTVKSPLPTVSTPVSVRDALGLVGTLDGGRNSKNNPNQERPRTTEEPAQTIGTRGNLVFTGADGIRRCLSPSECAVLQGFPDGWPFQGLKKARDKQVGNAVPPRLAEVVLRSVIAADAALSENLVA